MRDFILKEHVNLSLIIRQPHRPDTVKDPEKKAYLFADTSENIDLFQKLLLKKVESITPIMSVQEHQDEY